MGLGSRPVPVRPDVRPAQLRRRRSAIAPTARKASDVGSGTAVRLRLNPLNSPVSAAALSLTRRIQSPCAFMPAKSLNEPFAGEVEPGVLLRNGAYVPAGITPESGVAAAI